jgi:hypothetical protein
MNENRLHMFRETPEYLAAPLERKLTANELKVLRLVKSGDPYRDKGRGKHGRTARLRTIERLRNLGLVRATQAGFLRATGRGIEFMIANPVKHPKR